MSKLSSDEALRTALRSYMSELSEDYWCAGWLSDLEVYLWKDLTGEAEFLTLEEREKLRTLSALCDGWWTYDEFLSTEEWERRFAQGKAEPTA